MDVVANYAAGEDAVKERHQRTTTMRALVGGPKRLTRRRRKHGRTSTRPSTTILS
jgi:hypothetical protein